MQWKCVQKGKWEGQIHVVHCLSHLLCQAAQQFPQQHDFGNAETKVPREMYTTTSLQVHAKLMGMAYLVNRNDPPCVVMCRWWLLVLPHCWCRDVLGLSCEGYALVWGYAQRGEDLSFDPWNAQLFPGLLHNNFPTSMLVGVSVGLPTHWAALTA